MIAPSPYAYHAELERVIDGDSLVVTLDLFDGIHAHGQQLRLNGYNAPELTGSERRMGEVAREDLVVALYGKPLLVQTISRDAFGRWLADVWTGGAPLVTWLIHRGYGVAWDGKGKRPRFNPAEPYPLAPEHRAP